MTFQTFSGREYLKIDIANNFGHDKLTWDERIAWFDQYEHNLNSLVPQAAEPALFYAGIQAWKDVQANEPIGYMISLDATASGLQILAALTGDRLAAELCNVVDVGFRADAYNIIYNRMIDEIGDTAKITRDDTKRAIMTSLYSSKAVPKEVFGEGGLLKVFYNTMEASAPGAWEINETMLDLCDPNTFRHEWVLPDNFHVNINVMSRTTETVHFDNQPFEVSYQVNQPMPEGRSLGANITHSIDAMIVREITARCDYSPTQIEALRRMVTGSQSISGAGTKGVSNQLVMKLSDHHRQTGFLSARILNYLDENNIGHVDTNALIELLDSLPAKPFKVISVHDCFRCLPHYGDDLRRQYTLQLALIARSELLSSLASQLVGHSVGVSKIDPTLYLDILQSNYALS